MTSKHTKAGRRARRRAHDLWESWCRAPVRLAWIDGNAVVCCYVCRAAQRWGEERHHAGCSVLRLNPGLEPINEVQR